MRRTVLLGVVVATVSAPSAHAASYPVSYSFPHAVAAAGQSSTAPPLGANDFSCRPSQQHPYPVVLVHGLMGNQVDNWDTMAPLLADNGFCVFALTYGADPGEPYFGGLQAMEQSSHQLDAFVAKVLAATGARQVDLVGHSEGTVMPRYWMEFLGGASKVHTYVMIAPIWHGTNVLGVATLTALGAQLSPTGPAALEGLFGSATSCQSCGEFITGSDFMNNLNAHGMALPGVSYTDIVTRYDELVVPYTSGILNAPNVTNFTLQDQCPSDFSEHLTVAYDPVVGQDMLNALDPAHAEPAMCTLVLPGIGAPFPPTTVGLRGESLARVVARHWKLFVRRHRTRFVFTVRLRVGASVAAVRGAVIRFDGHRLRTGRRGRASIRLRLHRGRYRAVALIGGRRVAVVWLRVR